MKSRYQITHRRAVEKKAIRNARTADTHTHCFASIWNPLCLARVASAIRALSAWASPLARWFSLFPGAPPYVCKCMYACIQLARLLLRRVRNRIYILYTYTYTRRRTDGRTDRETDSWRRFGRRGIGLYWMWVAAFLFWEVCGGIWLFRVTAGIWESMCV